MNVPAEVFLETEPSLKQITESKNLTHYGDCRFAVAAFGLVDANNVVKTAADFSGGGGGSFLAANTARVDPSGDDGTGTVGDLSKPFLTVQGAINAFQASQTSGLLTIGKTYEIMTYVAGDNFTNVGGSNAIFNTFIASGTTPTDWSHGSILEQRPNWPVIDIGDNFFTEDLETSLNTLIFIGRNGSRQSDAEDANRPFNSLRFSSSITTNAALVLKDCNAIDRGPNSGTFPHVYIGSDFLTSGQLVIGAEYEIVNYQSGDDFTNVGGTNVTNNQFIATGTTPAVWTNSSQLQIDPQFQSFNLYLINARLYSLDFIPPITSGAAVNCYGDAHSSLSNVIGNPNQPINIYDFPNSSGPSSPMNLSMATICSVFNSVVGDIASTIAELDLYNSQVNGTNSAIVTQIWLNPSIGGGIASNSPIIAAFNRVTAQSAANASIATFTVGPYDSSFEVSMNMNVSAADAISTSMKCNYTDENNVARSTILPVTGLTGVFLANGLVVATGAFETPALHIRCKAGTTITLYTATGTFTNATYTAEGLIKQTQ